MILKYINIGKTGKFTKISFENTNIIIGSAFSECDLISIKNIFVENQSNQIDSNNLKAFINEIIYADLNQIFNDIKLVVFTNLEEIISWPFLLRKLSDVKLKQDFPEVNNQYFLKNYLKNIRFVTTEPISQISKTLLVDFYRYFNKLMNENIQEYSLFVNSVFIDEFLENLINLNYNCEYKIEDHLSIILGSSGYNLGSSNILFKYYNKKIVYLSKSSFLKYRYPKQFEFFKQIVEVENENNENFIEPDILICSEEIINFNNDFISQFENIINNINGIMQHYDRENNHYPSIFLPIDSFFILDFIDIIRFKISNEIKFIYLSNVIKSILEYSNVSHGFINKFYHDKIYEFKLPFNHDELTKNNILCCFDDFEEFIKYITLNETDTSYSCPKILMTNFYSLLTNGISSDLYEFFKMNGSKFDGFFNILSHKLDLEYFTNNNNPNFFEIQQNKLCDQMHLKETSFKKKSNFRYFKYNFDFRMNINDFNDIIFKKWKPKIILINNNMHELDNDLVLNKIQKEKIYNDSQSFKTWVVNNFNLKNIHREMNQKIDLTGSNKDMQIELELDENSNLKNIEDKKEEKIFIGKMVNKQNKENEIILKFVKPQKILFKDEKEDMHEIFKPELIFNNKKSDLENYEKIEFVNLFFENCFIVDKKDNILDFMTKKFINYPQKTKNIIFDEKSTKFFIEKENEKFFFLTINEKNDKKSDKINKIENLKLTSSIDIENKNPFNLEEFEDNLKEILFLNNMKINEILNKENLIQITIVKENNTKNDKLNEKNIIEEDKNYSEINIRKNNNEKSMELEIICENVDDSQFLNYIFQKIN